MQIPKRKSERQSQQDSDPYITRQKADELQNELDRIMKFIRPKLIKEVEEHAKLGDFSENAAYQIAKGKLRGINHRLLVLHELINNAVIIDKNGPKDRVKIGSTVIIESAGSKKTFQILGSQETDPKKGIISHLSPIGAALISKKINDEVEMDINGQKIKYKILKIT